jgi:hypothetical protein
VHLATRSLGLLANFHFAATRDAERGIWLGTLANESRIPLRCIQAALAELSVNKNKGLSGIPSQAFLCMCNFCVSGGHRGRPAITVSFRVLILDLFANIKSSTSWGVVYGVGVRKFAVCEYRSTSQNLG